MECGAEIGKGRERRVKCLERDTKTKEMRVSAVSCSGAGQSSSAVRVHVMNVPCVRGRAVSCSCVVPGSCPS